MVHPFMWEKKYTLISWCCCCWWSNRRTFRVLPVAISGMTPCRCPPASGSTFSERRRMKKNFRRSSFYHHRNQNYARPGCWSCLGTVDPRTICTYVQSARRQLHTPSWATHFREYWPLYLRHYRAVLFRNAADSCSITSFESTKKSKKVLKS